MSGGETSSTMGATENTTASATASAEPDVNGLTESDDRFMDSSELPPNGLPIIAASTAHVFKPTRNHLAFADPYSVLSRRSSMVSGRSCENLSKNSAFLTILYVMKNMVGSSMLPMPYGFSLGGVVPSIVVAILSGLLSAYTFNLLGRFARSSDKQTYRDIVEHYMGKRYGPWVDVVIGLCTFPVCLSYHIAILGCIEAMLEFNNITTQWYAQRWFLSIMLTSVVFMPMCSFTSHMRVLSFVSVLGVGALIYCFIFAAVDLGTSSDSDATQKSIDQFNHSIWAPPSGNWLSIIPIANVFAACYLVQYNAPEFYFQLIRPTRARFAIVSYVSTFVVFLFCVAFAMIGFARFGYDVSENVILGYSGAYGPWIAVSISLISSYPFAFDAGRRAIISATESKRNKYSESMVFWACTLTFIPLFTLLCIFITSLGVIVELDGALFGNLLGFIIPGLLLVCWEQKRWAKNRSKDESVCPNKLKEHNRNLHIGYGVAAVGVIMTVVGVVATFAKF